MVHNVQLQSDKEGILIEPSYLGCSLVETRYPKDMKVKCTFCL